MALRPHKTKIVCTVGPASRDPAVLEAMVRAGMDVARLNFSHGSFDEHAGAISAIRAAAERAGRRVAILADLPGPKMRVGTFAEEPVDLKPGDPFVLTTAPVDGTAERVSVSFAGLPQAVKPGDRLYLNDGVIELEVAAVSGPEVRCRVRVGGELRSRKGLNLPGIDLGISAFTGRDRECLAFAVEHGVDAVSQSFVETGDDIRSVREAARSLGADPFVIAKIERAGALDNLDGILDTADGIMIARGDLGVEIPIERMAVVQKWLMRRANCRGRPVITATQMLESMTEHSRPTRAEATDVANAILDGTDCVMLSGESAAGRFPVEAVRMLARIAAETEPHRTLFPAREAVHQGAEPGPTDLIAVAVENTVDRIIPAAVVVPTASGATARNVARFRLPVWIAGVSPSEGVCQNLQFSYGVAPVHVPERPADWNRFATGWIREHGLDGRWVVLTEGPAPDRPRDNHRMELIPITG